MTTVSPSSSQTSITRPTRRGVRNHPLEYKLRLAAEACNPEVSVARLAREHGINANLLFKWRLKYQRGEFSSSGVPALLAVRTLELSEAEAAPPVPVTSMIPASAGITIEQGALTIKMSAPLNRQDLGIVLDCLACQR